jgi:hypothetical protein
MAIQGLVITKDDVIAQFKTFVTDVANAGIVWNASSHPAVNTSAFINTLRTAPTPEELPTMIAADTLRTIFRDFSYNASSIRKVRAYSSGCWDSGTQVSNLISSYETNYAQFDSAGSGTIITGNQIKAVDWDAYMSELQAAYFVARDTSTTFNTCHCSCHGNCHGSRGRR